MVVALAVGEGDVARTAEHEYAAALTVGHDAGVAKTDIHLTRGGDACGSPSFDDGEDVAPGLAVVVADAGMEVDASVVGHTDVGTAVAVVGNSDEVTVGCGGDGGDTVGDSSRGGGGEYLELRFGSDGGPLEHDGEVGEGNALVGS